MKYKEALKIALERDKLYHDFNNTVKVVHQDGSEMTFKYAFIEWIDSTFQWFVVFTEHCGVHVFHKGDIESVRIVDKRRWWIKESNNG